MAKKFNKEEVVSGVIDFIKDTTTDGVLSEIAGELNEITKKDQQLKTVYIYTVFKMTDAQKEAVKHKLEKEVGYEVTLREVVDKKLLAGFKIRLGDWVYDASIKGQLESFKNEVYANT